jgi:serine O-acetyltransferase
VHLTHIEPLSPAPGRAAGTSSPAGNGARSSGIRTREDYYRYLEADRRALEQTRRRPRLFGDGVWRFERLLRAIEYHESCREGRWFYRPLRTLLYLRLHLASVRLGFTIPPHVFGPGLSIAHRGTIVVNSCARVGRNCRLHACTNIGSWSGAAREAPVLGDNVYVGPGAVLYGPITIADNIAIGANSVVNTSFFEPNITIAGAPARKVREAGTMRFAPSAWHPRPVFPAEPGGPAAPAPPGAPSAASAPPASADSGGIR